MASWTYFLFCSYALLQGACGVVYSDLEALGLACPERDSCAGYRPNRRTYLDRSCECDSDCSEYQDCCVDVEKTSSSEGSSRTDEECLPYGGGMFSGVYAVTRCDGKWNGSEEVKEKCEGPTDFRDPLNAAPVTSRIQLTTYRNLYCAECNHAAKSSLTFFLYKLACKGLDGVPKKEIQEGLSYDENRKKWGVNRSDDSGNSTFAECQIVFDVPVYLNRSVRFCRANLVSSCASNWTRTAIRRLCDEYTTAVYDRRGGYRNPHCALCNYVKVSDLSCSRGVVIRRKPFSFSVIIDIGRNPNDCPKLQVWDPFSKKCRKLVCALPGYVVRGGKCVKGD